MTTTTVHLRSNCSLCAQPLGDMSVGVVGGGSFHPECMAKTYTLRERAAIWLSAVRWRLSGRPVEGSFGIVSHG